MKSPKISNKIVKVDGRQLKQYTVQFGETPKKTILLLDNWFNLNHDIHRSTFANLCYEVCKAERKNARFVYMELGSTNESGIRRIIDNIEPDGVIFVNQIPFNRLNLNPLEYFGYVREWNGLPTILSTPFAAWSKTEGFEKGESGKSLIGFNLKHIQCAFRGSNYFSPITKKDLKFKLRIIKTIEQFNKFFKILDKTKLVAVDVETANLNRIQNTLYTMQFGLEIDDKKVAYILPWKQKDHTWSNKELSYIKKKLYSYFSRDDVETIFHFGQFDIGQISVALDLPFYPCKVWDTIAAEFCADENHKALEKIIDLPNGGQYKPYGLESVEARYGIFRDEGIVIGKEDRANMAKFSLDEIAEYGAIDVVHLLEIRKRQIEQCTEKFIGYKSKKEYKRLVIHQLGMMISTFSMLMDTGIYIDLSNAKELTKPGSIFDKTVEDIKNTILSTKNGQKANKRIMKQMGISPSGGMFSSQKADVLSLTKPAHLRTLFFDVMRLEPTKTGKSGEPSTDKGFQKTYKHIEEVKLFSHFNKTKILKSTFAEGIIKRYKEDKDFQGDGRLRPFFGFTKVLPGRISVVRPNSQNIATHADKEFELHKDLIKGIKGNFSVKLGRTMIGTDFSAHEIRVTGVITKDKMVKKTFVLANNAIHKYRLAPLDKLEEAKKILEREGDIHIINVRFFFKKDVDKKHPLRQNIKQIVFGTLYGKLAKALARDLGIEESEAQELIDILFERWGSVAEWITHCHKTGKETFMIHYPNHRIRHLWAYLHDDIWVERAMDRRAVNSPVQGFSSDIGIASVYTNKKWVFENITKKGYYLDSHHTNIVHDAGYSDCLYEHTPFAIYLTEHAMSTLPMEYYKEKFDFEISIPLSYGLEFGSNWASLNEWDFRPETLISMLEKEGQRLEKSPKSIKKVLDDAKFMLKIRERELRSNPYKMAVGHNSINEVFEGLNMFKNQVE